MSSSPRAVGSSPHHREEAERQRSRRQSGAASLEPLENRLLLSDVPHLVCDCDTTCGIGAWGSVVWDHNLYVGGDTGLYRLDPRSGEATLIKSITFREGSPIFVPMDGGFLFSIRSKGLWWSDGTAAGTVQLSQTTIGSYLALGAITFFSGFDAESDFELWKTDGTPAGTVRVKDIQPGSSLSSSPSGFVAAGGRVYFTAQSPVTWARQLYVTDGTADGTHVVEPLVSAGFTMNNWVSHSPVSVGDSVYLTDSQGVLWRTNGTAAGTWRVTDTGGWDPYGVCELIALEGSLFFGARGSGYNTEALWRTDGTPQGTRLVKDFGYTDTAPANFANVNGRLYFSAYEPASGIELWTSDGTTDGTRRVADLTPGTGSSSPYSLTDVDGTLFFGTRKDSIQTLWRSDGTSEGTRSLMESPLPFGTLHRVEDVVCFWTRAGLFVSDETAAGTRAIAGLPTGSIDPRQSLEAGGIVYFTATSASTGRELWKTDGTAAGTMLLKDIYAGIPSSSVANMTDLNGALVFTAWDAASGCELWRSDGTPEGTFRLKDIDPGIGSGVNSDATAFAQIGSTLYFVARDGSRWAIWKTDGTTDGTRQVSANGQFVDGPLELTVVGDTVFFCANGGGENELWRTDGTEAGTRLVKRLRYYFPLGGSCLQALVEHEGVLYFSANDSEHPSPGMWRSDGTSDGTFWIADVPPDGNPEESNRPSRLSVGGVLYYVRTDAQHGSELWRTDGTTEGTGLVCDIVPGTVGSRPMRLAEVNGMLMFFTRGGLWRTDGTSEGTVMLKALLDLPVTPSVVVDDRLFFTAWTTDGGYGLWCSDGTAAGTKLVPGLSRAPLDGTWVTGGCTDRLYFTHDDGHTGRELWVLPVAPLVRVANTRVYEGGDGFELRVDLTLSRASSQTVTVRVSTFDGSAVAGEDYLPLDGEVVVFQPGQTTQTVAIKILGDGALEADETFALVLGEPTNADVQAAPGELLLLNDDVLELSGGHAAEDAPAGTGVGSLLLHGVPPGETPSFTLVDGAGDTHNNLFEIRGSEILLTGELDRESQASLSIRVRSELSDGTSSESILRVTVDDVNEAPRAESQRLMLTRSASLSGRVSGSDPEGESLSYSIVAPPSHGRLELTDDGAFSYVPEAGFVGSDTFLFATFDGVWLSEPAQVTLQVFRVESLTLAQPLVFMDADGDLVTIKLKGAGAGTAYFAATGWCDLSNLVLKATNEASVLTVTAKGPAGRTQLGGIDSHGRPMRGILAPTAALQGAVLIGPSLVGAAITLQFDVIQDARIELGMPLKSLTASAWLDADATPDVLSAPAIGCVTIKGSRATALRPAVRGDLQADLHTSRLGTLSVRGLWDGAELTVDGYDERTGLSIKSITAGGVGTVNASLTGGLAKLRVSQWQSGIIAAGWIGSVRSKADAGLGTRGNFGADLQLTGEALPDGRLTLASVTIGGDLEGACWDVRSGSVGKLLVGGTATGSIVRSAGNVRSITLGAAVSSDFGAGVDLDVLRTQRHADAVSAPVGVISAFTVKGLKLPPGTPVPRFFIDSCISAGIGKLSLLNWDGQGGLYAPAGAVRSVTHRDTAEPLNKWTWPPPITQLSSGPDEFIHIL
jgi:ELWxxDGT repeat protein